LAHDHLTYEDLLRIVELVKASEQFSEFRLKVGEIEVELRRGAGTHTPAPASEGVQANKTSAAPRAAAPITPKPAPAAGEPLQLPEGATVVRSPMVGTFYRSPEPGAPPFVELGRHVESDTIVCIIEVMKLMNSIPAGARGTVAAIMVADASPVEAGQSLIVLQPDAEPE
jgi:acetyl-CoA carboxylase biotin carboxyl carrier protein